MASKTSEIIKWGKAPPPPPKLKKRKAAAVVPVAEMGMSMANLKTFKAEVEDLGVSAMQYRQRTSVEKTKFAKLGVKPDKTQRIPASIGRGLNKANVKREKAQVEEARMQGLKVKKPIKKVDFSKERGLGNVGMPGKYSSGVFYLNKQASTKRKEPGLGKKRKKKGDGFNIKVVGMSA